MKGVHGSGQASTSVPSQGVGFQRQLHARKFRLNVYWDANWVNNPDDGKSTSSYIVMMCNGPVSFKVGMQGLTAKSAMEAEFVVVALTIREAVFCHNLMA